MNRIRLVALLGSIAAGVVAVSCGSNDTDCAATATCAPAGTGGSQSNQNDAGLSTDSNASSSGDTSMSTTDSGLVTPADSGAADGAAEAPAPTGCKSTSDCDPGTVCSVASTCIAGCTPEHACASGQACCGATCANLDTDLNHCGTCEKSCTVKNGTPACKDKACAIASCLTGYADCNHSYDDGCEDTNPGAPSVPALVQPFAGAYTGSLHAPAAFKTLTPTFTWKASTGGACGKLTYQIQIDDSCTLPNYQGCAFPSTVIDEAVTTTSFTTALDVSQTQPTGRRYYWRVRACDGLMQCSAWSRVSYVEVGRLSNDLNGDGYSDAAIVGGDYGTSNKHIFIYYGGSSVNSTLDATRDFTSVWSVRPVFVGDLNADGYADLVVTNQGDIGLTTERGQVDIYLGGPSLSATPASPNVTLMGAGAGARLGFETGAAGDLDGDGYADFAAGAILGGTQKLVVYKGGATVAAANVPLDIGGRILRVGGGGDLDQDGYADLVASASPNSNDVAYVYRGGAPLASSAAATFIFPGYGTGDWDALALGGDMNGDGFADVALIGFGTPSGSGFLFGSADLSTDANHVKQFPLPTNFTAIAGGYDITGDGLPDVLIGTTNAIAVLAGGKPPPFPATLPTYAAPIAGTNFGAAIGMGDYDGDGYGDAIVGAPSIVVDAVNHIGGGAYFLFGGVAFPPTRTVPIPNSGTTYSFGSMAN